MEIEAIPFGKKNRVTKEGLMDKFKISSKEEFAKKLQELRKKYVILSDASARGYWRPDNVKELEIFIKKCNMQNFDTSKAVMLAYQEVERLSK